METQDFFYLARLPVHVGVVYESADKACRAAVGSVTLAYCSRCGLVFNRSFEPKKLVFMPGYEVQLIHSPRFVEFLTDLSIRLIARYELHGKDVLDIGCGAGHFLKMLCEGGGNRGIGIDPTLTGEGPVALQRGEMRRIRGLFGGETADSEYDFASCQSVLEDISDPVSFLSAVRRIISPRRGHAYLEVFDAFRAFAAGEVWSITYEQCNYYSLASFTEAVCRAGFHVVESGSCYSDQYLYVEAAPAEIKPPRSKHAAGQTIPSSTIELPTAIEHFAQLHAQKRQEWQLRIEEFRLRGTKAVVWGAGGKGICFLNTVGAQDVFKWVVDINPDRQNRHVPGSGQLIIGPARLKELQPDVIVLTNPLYEAEIRSSVSDLSLECDFLKI